MIVQGVGTVNDRAIALTDASFHRHVASDIWIIDFWAEWCEPCHALSVILADVAIELKGKIMVGTVNIVDEVHTAREFAIKSLPTLLIFKDGQVHRRLYGLKTKRQILNAVTDTAA